MTFSNQRYESLRMTFAGQRLPLAFVDLDAFDANVDYASGIAKSEGKTLRIGTKSMRCLRLMERVLAHPSSVFRGFLTFTAEETCFLAEAGHDDFILAYPTVQPSESATSRSTVVAAASMSLLWFAATATLCMRRM